MTTISDLLQDCLKSKDETARLEVWAVMVDNAVHAVEKLLRKHRLGRDRAEDVFQELYVYLHESSWGCLQTFRGTTEGKFQAFLYRIALNFAKNWVRTERKCQRDEGKARRGYMPSRE